MTEDARLNESTETMPADGMPEAAPSESAGARLAALRQSRGWTAAQVASQLNLAVRQIEALEQDNYAALPGMVIVRGFIRSYAKLLQVDPAPILALLGADARPQEVLPARQNAKSVSFSEARMPSATGGSGTSTKVIAGLIALLLIAGGVVLEGRHLGWKLRRPAPAVATDASTPQVAPTPEEADRRAVVLDASAVMPASAIDAASGVATDASSAQPASEAVATAQAGTKAAAAGKNVLALQIHQDSWIEIRRADNSILFSGLMKAGASQSFDLPGPVSLVVGNAAGVTATLRGAPVDLKGNASNVARLNLQ